MDQSWSLNGTQLGRRSTFVGPPQHGLLSSHRARFRSLESHHLARFRRRLAHGAWLFPRCFRSFFRFGCRLSRRRQFPLGPFRSAMVAMVQWLDASGFFFPTYLSLSIFLVLVIKVFGNCFCCHVQSVAELSLSKLSNFGHSVKIHRPSKRCQHRV